MKRLSVAIPMFLCFLLVCSNAYADLDSFLSNLNNEARTDSYRYSSRLSNQFGESPSLIQTLLRSVSQPADAFMCLQLARMTNSRPELVLQTYQHNRGRGWGVIAKELGIKPGSAQFHALKRGDFSLSGQTSRGFIGVGDDDDNRGHGKGKGKGHNK